jgi:hydrogenase expression/formation protein HypC
MCLAVPARVVEIKGDKAIADFGGIRREVLLTLVGKVKIGDYLIVHTGYAIQVMNRKEAEETLKLWKEILQEQKL